MNSGYGIAAAPTYGFSSSSYPADVQFPAVEERRKLFAVPVVGYAIKMVMLIPHLVILYVLGLVVAALQYVLWIPVLFTGRYPDWGHLLVGGHLSWQTRVLGYLTGLSDTYPAFSLTDPGDPSETHMLLQTSPTASRFYAIPLVGGGVKMVMLIPHVVILYVLGIVAGVALLLAWIPVLTSGRYPTWGVTLIGGTIRWFTRVYAFWFGLTDAYPPFSLGS